MLIYWLLFAFFAAGALVAQPRPFQIRQVGLFYAIAAVILVVLIGLRYEVGADWNSYEFMYSRAGRRELFEAMAIGDSGYQAVNWLSYQAGAGIWLVNLVCAAIFVWGLFRFCATQPLPWVAVLVAVPYTAIVVAMGYTRQAVALGIILAGLAAFLRGGSPLRLAMYVIVASLFHRTAVIVFPLVALASERNRFANVLVVAATSLLLYDFFLGDAMDDFIANYIERRYSSQGAAIRIVMNMVAAAVFWFAGRQLHFTEIERRLWRNFSIATVVLLVLLILLPSSTAVDRMSIYVIPLQIAVLGRLPVAFTTKLPGIALVGTYMFLVQFVWLNFASHSRYWVPYQFFAG